MILGHLHATVALCLFVHSHHHEVGCVETVLRYEPHFRYIRLLAKRSLLCVQLLYAAFFCRTVTGHGDVGCGHRLGAHVFRHLDVDAALEATHLLHRRWCALLHADVHVELWRRHG